MQTYTNYTYQFITMANIWSCYFLNRANSLPVALLYASSPNWFPQSMKFYWIYSLNQRSSLMYHTWLMDSLTKQSSVDLLRIMNNFQWTSNSFLLLSHSRKHTGWQSMGNIKEMTLKLLLFIKNNVCTLFLFYL